MNRVIQKYIVFYSNRCQKMPATVGKGGWGRGQLLIMSCIEV